MIHSLVYGNWEQGTCKAFEPIFEHVIPINLMKWEKGKQNVVLFEGGTDVNPELYGKKRENRTQNPDFLRDADEAIIYRNCVKHGIPMIGVCRGAQFLNVMNGGTLIQHIDGHCTRHQIHLPENAWSEVIGDFNWIEVTSTHHQAMVPTEASNIIAIAFDSIAEIVWYPKTKCLCIQGHPEYLDVDDAFPELCRLLVKELIFK